MDQVCSVDSERDLMLYRIVDSWLSKDANTGLQVVDRNDESVGYLDTVEATNHLCIVHGHVEIPGRGFCKYGDEFDRGDLVWEYDCNVVSVVRMEE
jgi:hypothetical protein